MLLLFSEQHSFVYVFRNVACGYMGYILLTMHSSIIFDVHLKNDESGICEEASYYCSYFVKSNNTSESNNRSSQHHSAMLRWTTPHHIKEDQRNSGAKGVNEASETGFVPRK